MASGDPDIQWVSRLGIEPDGADELSDDTMPEGALVPAGEVEAEENDAVARTRASEPGGQRSTGSRGGPGDQAPGGGLTGEGDVGETNGDGDVTQVQGDDVSGKKAADGDAADVAGDGNGDGSGAVKAAGPASGTAKAESTPDGNADDRDDDEDGRAAADDEPAANEKAAGDRSGDGGDSDTGDSETGDDEGGTAAVAGSRAGDGGEPPGERTEQSTPEAPDAATRGRLHISEKAVRRIAEEAAAEVTGRESRPSGLDALTSRALPHVDAKVVGRHARLQVDVASSGERSLPDLAQVVRGHVATRVGELTGLTVDVVDVHVDRLTGSVNGARGPVLPAAARPARTGAARVTGFILALALIPLGAIAIYDSLIGLDVLDGDQLTVRFLEWLDRRPPETWMVPVGIALALLGLWLLFIAVKPRPKRTIPLRADTGVYITRRAIEALSTDTAIQHPGVIDARAKARKRSVKMRAKVDGDGRMEGELKSAIGDRLDRLARPVKVRTALREERRPSS